MTKRGRAASEPRDRVAYETPRLLTFGRVDALTAGALKKGGVGDGAGGSQSRTA